MCAVVQLKKWIMSPYKEPESNTPNNKAFNEQLSRLHQRSKHAAAYLKGRFQSLDGLPVRIDNKESHKGATKWILLCIAVHNFALQCEEYGKHLYKGFGEWEEPSHFIQAGMELYCFDCNEVEPRVISDAGAADSAKQRREDLKHAWLRNVADA